MLARLARCSVRASPRVAYAVAAPQPLCSVHHIYQSRRRPTAPALQQLRSFSFSFPGPRKLADITNLPLLEKEEGAAIAKIWTKFHDTRRDTVGLAIPGSELKVCRDQPCFIVAMLGDCSMACCASAVPQALLEHDHNTMASARNDAFADCC
jgi:hypothetical protein